MTAKPTKSHGKKSEANGSRFDPTGVTAQMAWDLWKDGSFKSLEALKERFKADGHTISIQRLSELLSTIPEYLENREAHRLGRPRVNPVMEVVLDLQAMEVGLRAKTWRGCRVKLITRLTEALETLKVETPDDAMKLLEADDKLAQLIHGLRGAEIDSNSMAGNGKVSLFDTSNNLVPLPSYRTGT
jgi:hypothetical protein